MHKRDVAGVVMPFIMAPCILLNHDSNITLADWLFYAKVILYQTSIATRAHSWT